MSSQKHSVVIVGGGVGGLKTASLLSKDSLYDVTLISRSKSFVHRVSLYRDKKGRSRTHISIPLQKVFTGRRQDLDLVRAHIDTVDPNKKIVTSSDGVDYHYDSLIMSIKEEGRKPDDFDESFSYSAYNSSRVNSLRRELILQFENRQIQENYIVLGAGEAGVEIVAELKRLLDGLAEQYDTEKDAYKVWLIEKEKKVLPGASSTVSSKVTKRLRKLGVQISLGREAKSLREGTMRFTDGSLMESGVVVVAAGTEANHFYKDNSDYFLLDAKGFVRVTALLEAEGYSDIYVQGNNKATNNHLDTRGILYDAKYIVDILHRKKYGKTIHAYNPPARRVTIELGKRWGVHRLGRNHFGITGWAMKRWLDRKHFSTLLPSRISYSLWLFGSKHDEIH